MPFIIYSELQSHVPIKDIVKNWKNIGKPNKNKAIIELVINMTGFDHEVTMNEIKQTENAQNYQKIVKNLIKSVGFFFILNKSA